MIFLIKGDLLRMGQTLPVASYGAGPMFKHSQPHFTLRQNLSAQMRTEPPG